MKKFLQKLAVTFLLINLALTMQVFAANGDAPVKEGKVLSPIEALQSVGDKTNLPNFDANGQHADAPPDFLQPGIGSITSPVYFALDLFRLLMSGIAMIFIIITSLKLMGTPTEDEATNAKRKLLWGVVGLILIQFADTLVKKMFFGEQGEAFGDAATTELFAEESVKQIRGIIGFVEIFLGAIAVFVLVIRGFALFAGNGEEEAVTKAKEQVIYAIAGLVTIGLAHVVILGFVFPKNGQILPRVEAGRAILVAVTNFISGFIAIASFVTMFYAGYQYVTAGGDSEVTEKVKKSFTAAIIALLIALGAFAIVNTFIKLDGVVEPPAENLSQHILDPTTKTVYKS